MLYKDKLLGRITNVYGQWNRATRLERGWPKTKVLDAATLKKYGYDTMDRLRNWRWYRKYSGGPIADLGSHQIDVFNWFLRAKPKSVMASGGVDYYKEREWYDNVMTIYEYPCPQGTVRGSYQLLNTTSYGGFYEVFMGDEGSLMISEDTRKGFVFREVRAKRRKWEDEAKTVETMGREAIALKVGETLDPSGRKTPEAKKLAAQAQKPVHQLHLENFFEAVRKGTPLSCPPEVGFETAVSVLKVNEALKAARRLDFKAEEFQV
jgi:predicted dehydrogenase